MVANDIKITEDGKECQWSIEKTIKYEKIKQIKTY